MGFIVNGCTSRLCFSFLFRQYKQNREMDKLGLRIIEGCSCDENEHEFEDGNI